MRNNHILIYYENNQNHSVDACFRKATFQTIRTVQQHSRNVSSGVEISYLKTINALAKKAKQESCKK